MSIEDLLQQWREAMKEHERLRVYIQWLEGEIENTRTESPEKKEEAEQK